MRVNRDKREIRSFGIVSMSSDKKKEGGGGYLFILRLWEGIGNKNSFRIKMFLFYEKSASM
jgi:hypothetical protein